LIPRRRAARSLGGKSLARSHPEQKRPAIPAIDQVIFDTAGGSARKLPVGVDDKATLEIQTSQFHF
jgi:hypothetical protein